MPLPATHLGCYFQMIIRAESIMLVFSIIATHGFHYNRPHVISRDIPYVLVHERKYTTHYKPENNFCEHEKMTT